MKKYSKVLTSSAVLALLATTAVTPAAVQAADSTNSLKPTEVAFVKGDKIIKLSLADYNKAVGFESISEKPTLVVYSNGEVYKLADYNKEYGFAMGDLEETYNQLKGKEVKSSNIVEGTINEEGKVVAKDETLEEKVNETFFYNLAA